MAILAEDFGMRHVSAKFILPVLIQNQGQNWFWWKMGWEHESQIRQQSSLWKFHSLMCLKKEFRVCSITKPVPVVYSASRMVFKWICSTLVSKRTSNKRKSSFSFNSGVLIPNLGTTLLHHIIVLCIEFESKQHFPPMLVSFLDVNNSNQP